jgi:hypothetical protein
MADVIAVFGNLDQSSSHRNSFQCLRSSLFSLDVSLLKSKPVNRRLEPAWNPIRGIQLLEKRAGLSSANTVAKLSLNKSIYDRFKPFNSMSSVELNPFCVSNVYSWEQMHSTDVNHYTVSITQRKFDTYIFLSNVIT